MPETRLNNAQQPIPAEPEGPDFSNAIRLTGKEWLGVGLFTVALILGAAPLGEWAEKFDLEPDYRIPYDLSNDYWHYERCTWLAASNHDTLLFGDSVVWGQYATRQQTLSFYLNEQASEDRFANLGLEGAHPAALAGLLEHYAGGVTGKNVVLHCNPLWMSSPKQDLQTDEQLENHPRLVPQFFPRIPGYKEEISPRFGIVVEQHLPFRGWTSHLQLAYYDKTDIPAWTLAHPYANPFEEVTRGLPPSDNNLRYLPISWTQRGIPKQDLPWVDLETSFQWRSFQRAVEILQKRGNHVFVLVGPFNEHVLTDESLKRYQTVKQTIETWLRKNKVSYAAPRPLPSELYGDLSHPLSDGYALLAEQIFKLLSQ